MNLNEGTRGAFPPSPRTPFFDGIKTPTGPHILLFCHLRQKLEKICDMICSNDNSSNGKCDGIKTPLGHHLTGLPTFLCHLNLTRAQFTF